MEASSEVKQPSKAFFFSSFLTVFKTLVSMAAVLVSPLNVGPIDDVQELTKTKPKTVPERFLRDLSERPTMDMAIPLPNEIPIIDLSKLLSVNKDEKQNELSKLSTACEEWGFFQVINHRIANSLLESLEELAREFFMLPLETKKKYPMAPGTVQGYGQAFVFSEDQKLDWINMFALALEPQPIRNPKLWPTEIANFNEIVGAYSKEISKLCQCLLQNIAVTLGLKGDVFHVMFGEIVQAIRMNYYPPCPRPDLVMGLSPHSDGSALTVLQQGKNSPVGLQILKDNEWVGIQPIPNALVINLGDTIEVLTNGRYKSVEHRAVTHETEDRLTAVTFYAPRYDLELGPLPEMVNEDNPCKYKRYIHGEYSRYYLTNKLHGKRIMEFAQIQTKNSNHTKNT